MNLSFIHSDAKIGKDVIIDPFVTVEKNVEIGDGTRLYSHAVILEGARIGKNCQIFPGAVIAAVPQDLKFVGEETTAVIGDNTIVRECATVNRGTASKGITVVGNNCLLMAYSHIAHDCILGDNIIIGNTTQVAGEVVIDDYAIVSAGTLVHQFTRIGAHVMIQGGSRISKDIPPFVTAGREPISFCGINTVGLRRRKFTNEEISGIQDVYRYLYLSNLNVSNALEKIEEELPTGKYREQVVAFVRKSERGILRGYID
ncbi:MAG: acyl-ACP--UDP-N-acetylglucosamine O-acyltransferase [Prevotellaceae bacterium]|jgi:UDP-N-acetylglucosamine acyltransferase|nr:acyl-ACP--UDP-N-acetylglucosamine O-acyltransferase [Prevotellaceae bacterium]